MQHRPRAVAALTRYFRSLDLAEDAFADACVKALVAWKENGPPRDCLAWLLTTARNAGLDHVRQAKRRQSILTKHQQDFEPMPIQPPDPDEMRDDVLRLLFICCHPNLERQDQIAMALKIVGGLSTDEIARGFLVKPKAMEQRITRAKKKVAAHTVAFETPSLGERGARLGEVSLMIYLMFNEGWSTSGSHEQIKLTLCDEAIRLARLLVDLFPGMGEQSALLALLLLQHARRDARADEAGRLVPLDDQNRTLWDQDNTAEALALLERVERINHAGAFRLQAAIAATHARAASTHDTDWALIEAHYAALYVLQPTPVVRLNHIAAQAKTKGPHVALQQMKSLEQPLKRYRWFHAMRGGLYQQIGDHATAITSFETVLTLGPTSPERIAVTEKILESQKILRDV